MTIRVSKEAQDWFEARDRMHQRHRVMTFAEYHAWCAAGDALAHPSDANAFPGGLTIVFDGRSERSEDGNPPTSNAPRFSYFGTLKEPT